MELLMIMWLVLERLRQRRVYLRVHFENKTDGKPIPGVTLTLQSHLQLTLAATASDSNGFYKFANLPLGNYTVDDTTNLSNDYKDVSDSDTTHDGDLLGDDTFVDNVISVLIRADDVEDTRNDFVARLKLGSIAGRVTDDISNTLAAASIELIFKGAVVETQTTGPDGIIFLLKHTSSLRKPTRRRSLAMSATTTTATTAIPQTPILHACRRKKTF